ncbi:hypothetical protein [Aeromicrobium choanae]|uniref:SnoaL-like domain-containing protein n=1 Tax=Aeromicrobium choanae TaxID=1736691 RepID=A0A1T4Z6P8_9ACTN|nr:hypothetical protein [Aeromicrobium choanae]SKB09548.1 hypothetical protein SAMN06295964_2750 [Aeromicrobium choanae]
MGEWIAALAALAVPFTGHCDALTALDALRALAWTSSDEQLLARAYVPGTDEADVERLRSWRERGITVEGARTVRASCRVGADGVEVVERLGPTVAVLADGTRRPLPADAWDRRIVEVAHRDGWWRIVRVR